MDPLTSPSTTTPPSAHTSEVKKVSFWVSQIFIVIATVLGVFLAANQGFKQALAFDDIRAAKNNYYLRLSLKNELEDNKELVRGYMKKIGGGAVVDRKTSFKLDTFVWESMKTSSATLETPSELLKESRHFYRQVEDIQEKVVTNVYGVKRANELLQQLVDHMEKDVLPKFEANLEEIKTHLKKQNIEV